MPFKQGNRSCLESTDEALLMIFAGIVHDGWEDQVVYGTGDGTQDVM